MIINTKNVFYVDEKPFELFFIENDLNILFCT